MAAPPGQITRGRFVDGDLDGLVTQIEPGQEIVEPFGMGVVLGRSPVRNEHLGRSTWVYRYVRVEEDQEGEIAIFEFVERRERT